MSELFCIPKPWFWDQSCVYHPGGAGDFTQGDWKDIQCYSQGKSSTSFCTVMAPMTVSSSHSWQQTALCNWSKAEQHGFLGSPGAELQGLDGLRDSHAHAFAWGQEGRGKIASRQLQRGRLHTRRDKARWVTGLAAMLGLEILGTENLPILASTTIQRRKKRSSSLFMT